MSPCARTVSYLLLAASLAHLYYRASRYQQLNSIPDAAYNFQHSNKPTRKSSLRLLYIVTSLAEYDSGRRATLRGYDRFANILMPVLQEGITSLLQYGYRVDFYLITHYGLSQERQNQLQALIQTVSAAHGYQVNLQVWSDATPLGYSLEQSVTRIMNVTRGLARQHRYVIKDKLLDYDLFVSFEDDMLIRGPHVAGFYNVTQELYKLRKSATNTLATGVTLSKTLDRYHGNMTVYQLMRMLPGFMRVEAALPGWKPRKQDASKVFPITVDARNQVLNASVCCPLTSSSLRHLPPQPPTSSGLHFWETDIQALSLRYMQGSLEWVVLQAGNGEEYMLDPMYAIGGYWSGRNGLLESRPPATIGDYANNQGGWMGTRRQIYEWETRWCQTSFLPPFSLAGDGLETHTVEFWSGGLQLVGVNACNLQRIIPLEPSQFSQHLLYHTSNNKQRHAIVQRRFSSLSIQDLWGQLNTVRVNAEREMRLQEMGKQSG
jgi:hypothetical protein